MRRINGMALASAALALAAGTADAQVAVRGETVYTMAGTLRGAEYLKWGMQRVPPEWYGHIPHTHRAIDDARGFANVLKKLFEISQGLDHIEATESMYKK